MTYILFAIVGLGLGAVYAGLGLGVVLVNTGTGVLNFAQGAIAMWGAYVFYQAQTTGRLVLPVGTIPLGTTSTAAALAAGILSSALVGALAYWLIMRPLRRAPALARIVATLGLLLTLQSLATIRFGSAPVSVNPIFPAGVIRIASDLAFPQSVLWAAGLVVVLAVVLASLFRFTRFGIAMRASAEDERAAELMGYSPQRLGGAAWIVSGALTGLVAIVTASFAGLNAVDYAFFIVPALAAAILGRLTSLWAVTAAGLAFGCVESELTFLSSKTWWPTWAATGAADVVPLLVIVIALYLTGNRLPTRGERPSDRLPPVTLPRIRPAVALSVLAAGGLAIAVTGGAYRYGVVTSMIFSVVALSLVLLTGFGGQVSLAQAALAGAGGYVLSRLSASAGLGFPWSLLVGTLAAGVIGLVVAIPALRIRGTQLAVVTLAAALTVQNFVFDNPGMSPPNGDPVPDARLFGLNLGVRSGSDIMRWQFGALVLVLVAVVFVLVVNLLRSDTGRALVALRSNERAAAAAGVSVVKTKTVAFFVAALLAGFAGGLLGYSQGTVSPASFGAIIGVEFLAFAYLGGITSLGGAIAAGAFAPLGIGYTVLTQTFNLNGGDYYLMVAGLLLLVTSVTAPGGVASEYRKVGRTAGRLLRRTWTGRVGGVPGAGGGSSRIGPLGASSEEKAVGPGSTAAIGRPATGWSAHE